MNGDGPLRVMISCGEPSGDLYAGALARELRQREPDVAVFGFGGPQLRAAGARLVGDYAGLSVTGLTEAIPFVPRFFRIVQRLKAEAARQRPDVFVAIDSPDFHFWLLPAIRRLGIPIVYYISPQLWAWRGGRINTMRRYVDRVLVIFPFEAAIYEAAGVPVTFVGHPLVDLAAASQPRSAFLRDRGLVPEAPTVALLPGSRGSELRHIAPAMIAALPLIRARVPDVQFIVAGAPHISDEQLAGFGDIRTVRDRTDDVLAASDVAITASGTATVQAALHECPMVVVYRLSALTYALGKPFVRVDTYAMANLVAGTRIVPELIQDEFTPARVAEETVRLLTDHAGRARTREALRRVREKLGAPGASGRAAEEVLAMASRALRDRRADR